MTSIVRRRSRGHGPRELFEICAVCNERHGPTYDFRGTLRHYGIVGTRANDGCIRRLIQQRLTRAKARIEPS